ncbi:DUF159 family protein [Corynebacterium sp. 13CS0277]|uniref:SOS response-associated peptidase n=1 Tax=Corynebacterium sp. 13CS0277 TaxID=2071994 RepID=UPI000D042B8D|nr:SOS response-associated peptidase [Corynebacterium sp. 13CS0277]PRQ10772.1 DUF159 family protein [Corynebacterium sp. 13CS0277]
MCGRFVLYATEDDMATALLDITGRVLYPFGMPPERYNIAPTTPIPIITRHSTLRAHTPSEYHATLPQGDDAGAAHPDELVVVPARWGLIPRWATDVPTYSTFNARVETAATKPTFRGAWREQRALIPMNAYYEWHDKQPYLIRQAGTMLFAAALFDTGCARLSTTMVTGPAEGALAAVHHRMPLFVEGPAARAWLDGEDDVPRAHVPAVTISPVDRAVGSVAHQGPHLIDPNGPPLDTTQRAGADAPAGAPGHAGEEQQTLL